MKALIILIPLSVFGLYLWMFLKNSSIQETVSKTWNKWKKKYGTENKLGPWFFALMCAAVSFPLLTINDSTVFVFAVASLVFSGITGAMPTDKVTDYLHYFFSVAAILLGLAGIWIVYGSGLPLIYFVASWGALQLLKVKNAIWWVEVIALAMVYLGVAYFQIF
jgi:hypothetical protein